MAKQFLILYLLACFFLLTACTEKPSGDNASKQPSSAVEEENSIVQLIDANDEVQALYSARCLNCHAIDLSGKMGEPTNLQKVHERLSYEQIVNVISQGRELMPAFGERLTEDEIAQLASWLSKQ